MSDADQQTADLRRTMRRYVEGATSEQLEAMREAHDGGPHLTPGEVYVADLSRRRRLEGVAQGEATCETRGCGIRAVASTRWCALCRPIDDLRREMQAAYGSPPDPLATARAVAEQAHYALTHPAAPTLRVDIPASYCGEGHHGIRTGTLVEERDGICQVLVAGHGVLVVPSKDVGR